MMGSSFLVALLLIAVASGSICENSPLSVVQLQGILEKALKTLANPFQLPLTSIYTPNLVKEQTLGGPKPCNPTKGEVQNCGYPFVYVNNTTPDQGAVSSTWTLLANPSVAYSGALTNQTKILHPTDPVAIGDVAFQIDFSEAIIWLGCTPDVTYFAHSKLLWAEKQPVTDPQNQILGALGDTLNNYNLQTLRTNTSVTGGGAVLIVYTASQTTYNAITKAFTGAGLPASAINVDPFPTNLVELGKTTGAVFGVGSRSSNLTLTETAYLFTPTTGYFPLAQASFPYIRLTAAFPHREDEHHPSISPLSVWRPKVDQTNSIPPSSAFAQSETIYEPHLLQAAVGILAALNVKLSAVAPGFKWQIYPQNAAYFEEFGEKYIFEHKYFQHGGTGTRDNNYYFYNPGLIPVYGTLNISVIVGLRHDSLNWRLLGKATPQALFWNLVYSDKSALGALETIKGADANLQHYNALPDLGGSATADPLDVIWVRVFGGAATTYQPLKNALLALGLAIPADDNVAHINPLLVIHHTYVNPDTGVAPWQASLVTPIQINIVGVPAT